MENPTTTGGGIDLSSTGPFAPPNDMSLEDYLRWLRIGIDLHTTTGGLFLAVQRSTKAEKPKALEDLSVLQDQVDAALDRLSRDHEFLIGLARKAGETGFQKALEQANPKDQEALASIRQKASAEGGFVPLAEKQLGTIPEQFSGQRARMKATFDTLRNFGGVPEGIVLANDAGTVTGLSSGVQCAVGVAMVVHATVLGGLGAVAVATGAGALPGAIALVVSGGEAATGGMLAGQAC